jgi:hypothetical protein
VALVAVIPEVVLMEAPVVALVVVVSPVEVWVEVGN